MLTGYTSLNDKPVRSERLEARVSKEQKQLFLHAALLEGRSLTEFVVNSAYEAAIQTVRKHEMMALGRQDQEAFVAALLDDTPPGDTLRGAARRYMERMEP